MIKSLSGAAFVGGLLFAAMPAFAQPGLAAAGSCTQAALSAVNDGYLAGLREGDSGKLIYGSEWLNYTENMEASGLNNGLLAHPNTLDFVRTINDLQTCTAFNEIIITDPKHPYVMGVAVNARGGKTGAIDVLITDAGDWLFNAANTLKYSKAENWGVIPEADRDSRETLIAAANAYLDSFNDKKVVVPWGSPCARLEGGSYTGKGEPGVATPEDTCNVGVPSGVKLINRRYIVDPSLGAVAVILNFGEKERPDSHTFRIEHGKIRYVHTITVCADQPNCGFPQNGGVPPSQAAAAKK